MPPSTADAGAAAGAQLIPLLVRTQIAVDDPVSENAVPMLEWLAYVTEAVPGCHGDGDPQVIGPTLVRLLHSFTRARVGPEILELVADVAGKQLHLMSRRDMAAFGVLVADLVAAAGDLIRLQHEWSHIQAAQQPVQLPFLQRFGQAVGGELGGTSVTIGTPEQASCGVTMILRSLWMYAKGSRQTSQDALHPCASDLWAHLQRVAGEGFGEETRDIALRLIEFLLSHSVFPSFVDAVLGALAETLATPNSEFWQVEPIADDAEDQEPSRREVAVRCLRHSIAGAVSKSPTPPHPAQYAAIMPGLVASNIHASVKVAACDFFAGLLERSPAALEGSHTVSMVSMLGRGDGTVQEGVVRCLRVAVGKRMPSQRPAPDRATRNPADALAPDASKSSNANKRRRLSTGSPEHEGVAQTESSGTELIGHTGDALLTSLQDHLMQSLAAPTDLPPTFPREMANRASVAAACVRVFLGHEGLNWNNVLQRVQKFLQMLSRPYASAKTPDLSFVATWTTVVKLLGRIMSALPDETTDSFKRSFTELISLPITQEWWRSGGSVQSDALPALVCSAMQALALSFPDGKSRITADTHIHLVGSEDAEQAAEAIRLFPYVFETSKRELTGCFQQLSKVWTVARRRSDAQDSERVLLAISETIGPMCCIQTAKRSSGSHESNRSRHRNVAEYERSHGGPTRTWCNCALCDDASSSSSSSSSSPSTSNEMSRIKLLKLADTFVQSFLADQSDLPSAIILPLARSISRILRHMDAGELAQAIGQQLVKAWLQLLVHQDGSIRRVIVGAIAVLTTDDCLCARQLFATGTRRGQRSGRSPQASDTPVPVALLKHVEELCVAAPVCVHQSMLQALGQLAQRMSHSRLIVAGALKRMLVQLTSPDAQRVLRVTAYSEIRAMAVSKFDTDPSEAVKRLVNEVKGELYPGMLLEWFRSKRDPGDHHSKVRKMVAGIATVMDAKEDELHNELLMYSLPKLVRYRANCLTDVVNYFVGMPEGTFSWLDHRNEDSKKMQSVVVMHHIVDVLIDGLLHCKPGQHGDFLEYLHRTATSGQISLDDLHGEIRGNQSDIIDAVVWEMGIDDPTDKEGPRERAKECMDFVALCVPGGRSSMAKLLIQHFPMMLERFNAALDLSIMKSVQSPGTWWFTEGSDKDGCHALRSLRNVIVLMKEDMKQFLPVAISTLKQVLERKALQSTALSVWSDLVHSVPATFFGPYLCQMVGHLMDLMDGFAAETVQILEHLIHSHRRDLRKHFHELPFLPRTDALRRVNRIIDDEVGETHIVDKLYQLLQGVYNDSAKVRALSLAALKAELCKHRTAVSGLIGGPGQHIDRVIDRLIAALRRGSTDVDSRVRMLSMECFGELGAIDPTKLPADGFGANAAVSLRLGPADLQGTGSSSAHAQRSTSLAVSSRLEDIALVAELINVHLTNVVKAAQRAVVHDKAAFAIQEILKMFASSSSSSASSQSRREAELWQKLQAPTKPLIQRFKTSKYTLTESTKHRYQGHSYYIRKSHQRWVSNWAYELTNKLQKCESEPPDCRFYYVCRTVIRMDMDTASFLLPYLVWDTVRYGTTEDSVRVTSEIVGVLQMQLSEAEQVAESQQVLFSLLDQLRAWADAEEKALNRKSQDKAKAKTQSTLWRKVNDVLMTVPPIDLANAALQCKAFQRALVNFERSIREREDTDPRNIKLEPADINFLQNVYVGLNDTDGLAGVASTRARDPSSGDTELHAQIVDHEAAGRWVDAITCYEVLLQSKGDSKDAKLNDGLMRCMRELGHFRAILTHAQGIIKTCSPADTKGPLQCGIVHAADAAWRLGEWDAVADLEQYKADRTHLSVGVGNVLRRLELHKSASAADVKEACSQATVDDCHKMRLRIGRELPAACMESYERAYPMICQLHQLQELEQACRSALFAATDQGCSAQSLVAAWDERLDLMRPQLQCREPVLSLRRNLLLISQDSTVSSHIGKTWLQLAQTARSAVGSDQLHTAAGALLQRAAQEAEQYHIEKAKLSWAQNNRHQAVVELTAAVQRLGGAMPPTATKKRGRGAVSPARGSQSVIRSKMQLLLGKYGQRTSQHSSHVLHHFEQANKQLQKWDKGYFYLAQYQDMMYTEAVKQEELAEGQTEDNRISAPAKKQRVAKHDMLKSASERLPAVISNYGTALKHGHKYLFRCLPRMLTLWFEFSERIHKEQQSGNASSGRAKNPMQQSSQQVDGLIRRFISDVPTYQWFTALPQLMSRSTHPRQETQQIVKEIVAHILAQYSRQAVWIVVPATKSKNAQRASVAKDMINLARQQTDATGKDTIRAVEQLIRELINVCQHKTQDRHVKDGLKVSQHFPQLRKALTKAGNAVVMMPSQTALTVALPDAGPRRASSPHDSPTTSHDKNAHHDAFPQSEVLIEEVEEKLQVLNSLMKPSRLSLVGTDGRTYDFLCKREDKGDMRKDSRLMEFNTMLNRLFRTNPESAKRALHLRTFSVCPLNEECGLIEWVPNTHTLRTLLAKIYEQDNTKVKTTDIRDSYEKMTGNQTARRLGEATAGEVRWTQEWCRPRFPPVFHKWLLKTFPEPSRWFATRLNCARSMAVWSMVGYVLGLGDRHGENILFDAKSGDCVHVDFSCLFEKGLALAQPEVVPFRLTPNMVDVLGVTGTEGAFREVSEVTMKLLRDKQDLLMTNLETFLHDPLVEWKKRSASEKEPPQATHMLGRVKAKLNGQGGTIQCDPHPPTPRSTARVR